MKVIFVFFSLLWAIDLVAKPLSLKVNAEAALLMNADTGQILYEKRGDHCYYPASITKIATAAYALESFDNELDRIITVPQDCVVSLRHEAKEKSKYSLPAHWLEPGGSHIGIKKGEALSLRDLLYGMMVASGNDAANVIAHALAGSVPLFVEQLNAYLKQLGCLKTTFYNPHGLFHPGHQTTAYDMAVLTRMALKHPTFREIVSTVRYPRPKTEQHPGGTLLQTNRLLRKGVHYNPKVIGVKTGYLSKASYTLVAAATHEGRTLIAVLLKAKKRDAIFRDANTLFDAAFAESKVKKVYVKRGLQKHTFLLKGAARPIKTTISDELSYSFYPAEEPELKCLLSWKNDLIVPLKEGQAVGQLQLCTRSGDLLQSVPLLAAEDVAATWGHRLQTLNVKLWSLAAFAMFTVAFVLHWLTQKK